MLKLLHALSTELCSNLISSNIITLLLSMKSTELVLLYVVCMTCNIVGRSTDMSHLPRMHVRKTARAACVAMQNLADQLQGIQYL